MKFVQFGDLHLDVPFSGCSPARARERRAAARALPRKIVELANSVCADAIICTGDVFDSPSPYLDSVNAVAEAFAMAKMPVFVAPGNHDPYTPTSPYGAVSWPENVHVFCSPEPETVVLPFAAVTGWANTERRRSARPLESYSASYRGIPEIFVLHGDVAADSPYFHFTPEELSACGADYVALGHVHAHFKREFGSTLAVMNGGVQSHRYGECGEKGVVLAEVTETSARAELVPLPGERCFAFECEAETPEDVARAFFAACPFAPEQTMADIVLKGTGRADLRQTEQCLSRCLSVRLTDGRSRPRALPEGKSLAALFARRAAEAGLDGLALDFGLAALENREPPSAG